MIETYRGAIYPWHCDHMGVLTGVHIDSQTRKACPFPAEIVERGRSLVRAYDLPT